MPKFNSPTTIFLVLIVFSLVVGLSIPAFYEWTDSDQSRPSRLLWQVPLGMAIGFLAFGFTLPWLPLKASVAGEIPRKPLRFSVRSLLVVTTVAAVAVSLLTKFPWAVSGLACGGTFLYLVIFCVRNPRLSWAGGSLIACMILPYAWIVRYKSLWEILPDLLELFLGLPTLVPSFMIGSFFRQMPHDVQWLTYLLTAFELAVGIWMIRLGPKRSIAYSLFAMLMSILGSLALLMMVLA